ncbi:putative bacteriocin immunity protein, partial [Pectobacterium atrosepticum SCRI1043]
LSLIFNTQTTLHFTILVLYSKLIISYVNKNTEYVIQYFLCTREGFLFYCFYAIAMWLILFLNECK